MSGLSFYAYEGFGKEALKSDGFSQSVRVPSSGSQIWTSGQGGLRADASIPSDFKEEVEQAFNNVESALKDAGASLENVFKLIVFFKPMSHERDAIFLEVYKRRIGHTTLLTGVGVPTLALDDMHIEIEAVAYVK